MSYRVQIDGDWLTISEHAEDGGMVQIAKVSAADAMAVAEIKAERDRLQQLVTLSGARDDLPLFAGVTP